MKQIMHYTPDQLEMFKNLLGKGAAVAAPAEGVYGYCCNPFNEAGLNKIIELKQRAPEKGFVVLISHINQLKMLAPPLTDHQKEMVKEHWPGQVTLVFPVKEGLPELLTGGFDTIAVRLPAKDYMQQYLEAWGKPLVSTSANISGKPPIFEQYDLPDGIFSLTAPHKLQGGVSILLNAETGEQYR